MSAPSKELLLRAAQEVFAERGVHGTKAEDITLRAGLPKEAFYLHFDSEKAALKQIVERWLAQCASFFAPPADYPDTPSEPDAVLDFFIERDVQLYAFLWQSRATMRVLDSCEDEYGYLFEAFRADLQRRQCEWLALLRRDGLFRVDIDVELAATLVGGAYEDLARKMNKSERRPPFEKWLEFAQDTFMRAFGTPEFVATVERRSRRTAKAVHERGRSFLAIGST